MKIQSDDSEEENILHTFFDRKRIEASRGLDFDSDVPIFINLTRLNHKAFNYKFSITNNGEEEKRVTVRLFLAPKFNEAGNTMTFLEQKNLWIEMDKFDYLLQPGKNCFQQKSIDSSVTISEDLTFRDLESGDGIRRTNLIWGNNVTSLIQVHLFRVLMTPFVVVVGLNTCFCPEENRKE